MDNYASFWVLYEKQIKALTAVLLQSHSLLKLVCFQVPDTVSVSRNGAALSQGATALPINMFPSRNQSPPQGVLLGSGNSDSKEPLKTCSERPHIFKHKRERDTKVDEG